MSNTADTRAEVNHVNNLFVSFAEEQGEDGRYNAERLRVYTPFSFDGEVNAMMDADAQLGTVYMTLKTCQALCDLINAGRFPVGGE